MKKSKYVNHNILFLIGSIYYLVTPTIIGHWGLLDEFPGMSLWHQDFQRIPNKALLNYFLIIFSYITSFYIGSFFVSTACKKKRSKTVIFFSRKREKLVRYLIIFSIMLLLFTLLLIFGNRESLFTGYTAGYNSLFLGQIATATIVALFFVIYLNFLTVRKGPEYHIFFASLIISAIALLSLGSRMYVLIPGISLIIYKFNFSAKTYIMQKFFIRVRERRPTFFKLIVFFTLILAGLLIVGAWRIGSTISYKFLIYLFFAEPTFTWWSASTFLSYNSNNLYAISFPSSYITSFINFFPSILIENKSELILPLSQILEFRAPLGATSLFVSLQINFGWLLGSIFMMLVGAYYSWIERLAQKKAFFSAYYILILSVIPLQFFRDDFSILNKQLFWNMLIVPALILFSARLFYRMSRHS